MSELVTVDLLLENQQIAKLSLHAEGQEFLTTGEVEDGGKLSLLAKFRKCRAF